MSTVQVYKPSAIVLPTGNPITQIEDDFGFDPSFDDLSVTPNGSVFPQFTGSNSSSPQMSTSTTQIKDVLDFCTSNEIAQSISADTDLEYYVMENKGTRPALGALSHLRLRGTSALFYWSDITATDVQPATITFSIMYLSTDGVNPPLVKTASTAITATPLVQHVYGLAGLKIGGGFICLDSMSWAGNINQTTKTCSGASYPTYSYVENAAPIVTMETENVDDVTGYLPAGGSAAGAEIFLRKRLLSGINVPNATTEHIKITITSGTIKPAGDRQLTIMPQAFSVDTAAAIS